MLRVLSRQLTGGALRQVTVTLHQRRFRVQSGHGQDDSPPTEDIIKQELEEALRPTRLQVDDVSGGCGSMFNIEIASPEFKGKSQVKQQRMVNSILKKHIKNMHGLVLSTSAE